MSTNSIYNIFISSDKAFTSGRYISSKMQTLKSDKDRYGCDQLCTNLSEFPDFVSLLCRGIARSEFKLEREWNGDDLQFVNSLSFTVPEFTGTPDFGRQFTSWSLKGVHQLKSFSITDDQVKFSGVQTQLDTIANLATLDHNEGNLYDALDLRFIVEYGLRGILLMSFQRVLALWEDALGYPIDYRDYQLDPKLLSLFQLISQGGSVEEHDLSVNEAFDLINKGLYSYPLRFQYGFRIDLCETILNDRAGFIEKRNITTSVFDLAVWNDILNHSRRKEKSLPYPGYALIDILEHFSFLSLRRGEYLIKYTVDHEELSVVFRSALCATLPILGSINEHVLFSEYKTKLQDLASQNDESLKELFEIWKLHDFEEDLVGVPSKSRNICDLYAQVFIFGDTSGLTSSQVS